MTLYNYLKQFKNICWYPSAYKDSLAMVCLSYKSLRDYGISRHEAPDCFIFTDYETYTDQAKNNRFFLDVSEYEDEVSCNYYSGSDFSATAFNIKELDKIKLSFDNNLVAFEHDKYYGRVFVADVLIKHPNIGEIITKLVYVVAENTAFAFDFLIKKNIKVKYIVHSRYGDGFGGGRSNGAFMCNIFKELGTKYFASDLNNHYDHYGYDVADEYLTGIQRNTLPILKKIDNFEYKFGWYGNGDTILYEIMGYKRIDSNEHKKERFLIYDKEKGETISDCIDQGKQK